MMTSAGQEAGPRPGGFLRPYAEIFRIPRAWRFCVAGVIGRMPMSMAGLGTVLLISALTGRYGLAGSVSAASAMGLAAGAPQVARLVDRYGQGRVLPAVAALFALSVLGLILAVQLRAASWTYFLPAVVSGAATPSLGPMSRARWSALLAGTPLLHTAFSLESVADEVCFVVGPAAVTVLSAQVHPAAGIGVAAALCLAGTLWFAGERPTEPAPRPAAGPASLARLSSRRLSWRRLSLAAPGLAVLLPAYFFLGAMFVAIDLSTVAFATSEGYKALSGLILGLFALGSGAGGLWYGTRSWKSRASRRFAVTLVLIVAGVATFGAMPNVGVLAGVIFACGLTIAPTLIAGYSILESTARPGRTTEAMSWVSTGIGVGAAAGSTAAGFIIDAFGPRWGYGFAGGCGAVAAVIYLAGLAFTGCLRDA